MTRGEALDIVHDLQNSVPPKLDNGEFYEKKRCFVKALGSKRDPSWSNCREHAGYAIDAGMLPEQVVSIAFLVFGP